MVASSSHSSSYHPDPPNHHRHSDTKDYSHHHYPTSRWWDDEARQCQQVSRGETCYSCHCCRHYFLSLCSASLSSLLSLYQRLGPLVQNPNIKNNRARGGVSLLLLGMKECGESGGERLGGMGYGYGCMGLRGNALAGVRKQNPMSE